jgi:hypothetical protein
VFKHRRPNHLRPHTPSELDTLRSGHPSKVGDNVLRHFGRRAHQIYP